MRLVNKAVVTKRPFVKDFHSSYTFGKETNANKLQYIERKTHPSFRWFSCRSTIMVELEFTVLAFVAKRKLENPEKKTEEQGESKQQSQLTYATLVSGVERSHYSVRNPCFTANAFTMLLLFTCQNIWMILTSDSKKCPKMKALFFFVFFFFKRPKYFQYSMNF